MNKKICESIIRENIKIETEYKFDNIKDTKVDEYKKQKK